MLLALALAPTLLACDPSPSTDAGAGAGEGDAGVDGGGASDGGDDAGACGGGDAACVILRPACGSVLDNRTQDENLTDPGFQYRVQGVTRTPSTDVSVYVDSRTSRSVVSSGAGLFSVPDMVLPTGATTVCATSIDGTCCSSITVLP